MSADLSPYFALDLVYNLVFKLALKKLQPMELPTA